MRSDIDGVRNGVKIGCEGSTYETPALSVNALKSRHFS